MGCVPAFEACVRGYFFCDSQVKGSWFVYPSAGFAYLRSSGPSPLGAPLRVSQRLFAPHFRDRGPWRSLPDLRRLLKESGHFTNSAQ